MPVQITELLNKLQQIFQQADLSKLQVSFTYTPTPGSWQAAVQSDGLPGLIGWLQKDDAKGGNSSDKKGTDTKPADNGSTSSDLLGAINHIGQLFIAMVKPDPAAPSDQKRSPDKKEAPPATEAADTLQRFNKLLTDLMPSKTPPKDEQSTPPNSTPSTDKTTNQPEWRTWAEKGLDTFNKLLGDSIKTATGKKSADSDDKSTSQDKKETPSTSKDEDDSETSDDESNDKQSDDTDEQSDTSDSDSDSNDDDSGSDTPDVEDAEIVADASRDHLLDV